MAKKLIDTKSVISYDEQLRHSMNHVKFKNMIQKGSIRAEKYSMLDMRDRHRSASRRGDTLSERSYNSARVRNAHESPSSLRSRKKNKFFKMQKTAVVSSALHSQTQHMKKFARPVDGAGSVVLDLSQDTPTHARGDEEMATSKEKRLADTQDGVKEDHRSASNNADEQTKQQAMNRTAGPNFSPRQSQMQGKKKVSARKDSLEYRPQIGSMPMSQTSQSNIRSTTEMGGDHLEPRTQEHSPTLGHSSLIRSSVNRSINRKPKKTLMEVHGSILLPAVMQLHKSNQAIRDKKLMARKKKMNVLMEQEKTRFSGKGTPAGVMRGHSMNVSKGGKH